MAKSLLFINSLEKGLVVLTAFRHHHSMSLQDIARECDISGSSAQRVAYTLENLGYLIKDPVTRRYTLSVKALSLGYSYLAHEPLFKVAHNILHHLHQDCGENVNLSVPEGNDMVFVIRIHTSKNVPIYMPVGSRIPLVSSASGRAVLSLYPQDQLDEILADMPVRMHTSRTTTDKAVLKHLIIEARDNGFAYADDEFFQADVNVAAAVVGPSNMPIAAVNISVPKPRWSLARAREELGPKVMRAARAISGRSVDLTDL